MTPEASIDSLNRAPSTDSRGFLKSNGFAAVVVGCLLTISAFAGAQGADCLISPPGATVTCPAQPLPALQVFNVGVPAVTNPTSSFTTQWTLLSNTAGASIVGLPSCGSLPGGATCPVTVQVTQVGSVIVRADLVITTPTGQMVNKTCEVTLTVIDNGPPIITCPPDVNVECNTPTTPSVTGTATATDPCGSASVTFTDAITGSTCAGSIITRTWTATDGSGNTATCAQIITTVDTTPPSITCPGPASVQCFSQVPAPNVQLVTASDNCGGLVTLTFAGDSASNGTSSCNNVITRTYLATDPCGNTNTCTQLITVNDTTAPSITCPGPASVQCFSQVPAPNPGSVTTSDNCGGLVAVTHAGDAASNGTSSCNNVITRTYVATDPCGNTNSCTQLITVNDTTPPTIQCPGPASVQCFSQVPAPNPGSVTTGDNCGGLVLVTHAGDLASNGTSSCNNVITRTYLATDLCGNTNTCTQLITVNDTTPPSIQCPGPVSVQCFSSVPGPSTTSVTASDNCGGVVTVTHTGDQASNGTSNCNNVITRTYLATDPCGNTNTCTQLITVNDTTPPSIACPGPASVQCFSLVPGPNIQLVTASDNCGGLVTVTFAGDSASNGTSSCNNVITRTYLATDPCGNTNTCTQLITVNDTTAPSITCPGPVSVECSSQVPQADPGSVTTSDNCGGLVTVTHVGDSASTSTPNCTVVTRTYQATDPCGNTNTCTQLITVSDTTPPLITCPPNASLPCGSPTDPMATGFATATDNCDPNPAITWSDVQAGMCNLQPAPNPTDATITRTWTATDSCNNTATCTQIITLVGPPLMCTQPLVANLGGGCGAPSAPQLSMSLPMPGGFVSLHVGGAAPNSQLILAAQLPPFAPPNPITPPCVVGVDLFSPTTMVMDNLATDSAGEWLYAFLLVPMPELTGLSVRIQAGVVSPGGPLSVVQLSDAIEGTIGNCPPCTASLEDWGGFGPIGGAVFAANYATLFPAGMDVGVYNPGNGPLVPNGLHWTGDAAGQGALHQFLGTFPVPGLTNNILFQDFLNPVASAQATIGSGSFARYIAVLQLNIAFSAAGLLGGTPIPQPGIGALIYMNPGDSLNGFSVLQILAACNNVLAGVAPLPAGYTLTTLTGLLEELSLSYANCIPSFWASTHLFVDTMP